MLRPHKITSLLIATLLLLVQTQTLWAATSRALSPEPAQVGHIMSIKMSSAEMAGMHITLECENLCNRSTQSPAPMSFVMPDQPALSRIDLLVAYLIHARTHIDDQVEKLELPPPKF